MPDILYDKLSRELEEMIRSGKFGNKLPGIHKLAKILGANHITVRKAVELLIDRGELEVIPSRGTFVRENEKCARDPLVRSPGRLSARRWPRVFLFRKTLLVKTVALWYHPIDDTVFKEMFDR